MSKTPNNKKTALTVTPDTPDYDIGYGKPPEATRFKPGRSGNPGGRPKGSKNKTKLPALNDERLKEIILEEAYRTVTINDTGGQITIPMAQAVVRSLAVAAAKGNQRSQYLFTELLSSTERDNKLLHNEYLETAIQYKVDWGKELEYRERTGATGPEPIPHPDHIKIDFQTGHISIKGPMTKEDKIARDELLERRDKFLEDIAENEKRLQDNPDCEHRQLILDDIEDTKRLVDIISRLEDQ